MTRNQLAKEVAETTETVEAKGSEKTNELKVTDDLCATIADKEDEELRIFHRRARGLGREVRP
jgi:hypothetical protein